MSWVILAKEECSLSSSVCPAELPKRKTARRKAKQEAVLRRQFAELSDDEEPADTDSDSDPVWTPPVDEVSSSYLPLYQWI